MEQKYSPGVVTLFLTLNKLFNLENLSPLLIKSKLSEINIHHILYLCKEFGVDSVHLYSFVWSENGPFNDPDEGFEDLGLAYEFNQLLSTLNIYPEFVDDLKNKSLLGGINEKILQVRPLINSFQSINPRLTKRNWLKLLASVCYLKYVSGLDNKQIKQEIKKNQQNSLKYVTLVIKILDKYKTFQKQS